MNDHRQCTHNLEDIEGRLHRASCIINYVSERALDNDDVGLGETLKSAEELVLQAMQELREAQA